MLLTLLGQVSGPRLYAVIYPSNLAEPLDSQIKLGKDVNGNAATWAGSVPSPTSSQTYNWATLATGLTSGQSYKVSFVWSDGTSYSNVATSSAFTTDAGTLTVTFAVTESSDTASIDVSQVTDVTLAVSESVDVSSIAVVQINAVTSSVTESVDTTSTSVSQLNTVTSAVTENSDTHESSVSQTTSVTSAVTESTDVSASDVSIDGAGPTVNTNVTENSDTHASTVSQTTSVTSAVTETIDVAQTSIDLVTSTASSVTESSDTTLSDVSLVAQTVNAAVTEARDSSASAVALFNEIISAASEFSDSAQAQIESGDVEPVRGGAARKKPQKPKPKRTDWELPYYIEEVEDTKTVRVLEKVVQAVDKQWETPSLENTEAALKVIQQVKVRIKTANIINALKQRLIEDIERMEEELEDEETAIALILDDD